MGERGATARQREYLVASRLCARPHTPCTLFRGVERVGTKVGLLVSKSREWKRSLLLGSLVGWESARAVSGNGGESAGWFSEGGAGLEGLDRGSNGAGSRRGVEGCWWMKLEERKGAVRGARNHGGSVYTPVYIVWPEWKKGAPYFASAFSLLAVCNDVPKEGQRKRAEAVSSVRCRAFHSLSFHDERPCHRFECFARSPSIRSEKRKKKKK